MEVQKDENEKYKIIVVIATIFILLFVFAKIEEKVEDVSVILGFIIGPVLLYLVYRIIKAIWPDFW